MKVIAVSLGTGKIHCLGVSLEPAFPFHSRVLQHVGWVEPCLPKRVSISKSRIPHCVLWVSQRCVTLVIQNWIRYGKAAQEGPHIRILPSQHRVNPHHFRPVPICWGERGYVRRSWVSLTHSKYRGLNGGVFCNHSSQSWLQRPLKNRIVKVVSRYRAR